MRVLLALVLLGLIFVSSYAQSRVTGFQSVPNDLQQFQTATGGFEAHQGAGASLQATAQALFLSTLFGLRDKVDAAAAIKFVESVKRDHGFSDVPGHPADITSLRNALLCYGYLGITNVDKNGIEGYIRSLYDSESKLFTNKAGGNPSLKATAEALESFKLLSVTSRDQVSKIISEVRAHLQASIVDIEGVRSFSFPGISGDKDSYEANVYGIIAADYAGVEFGSGSLFSAYFAARQTPVGAFAHIFGVRGSLEASFQAVAAFAAIYRSTKFDGTSIINEDSLLQYVINIPHDLNAAFLSHFILSHTPSFHKVFASEIFYDSPSGGIDNTITTIIQGIPITPVVRALPFNAPHAGLNVEAVLSHASGADKKFKLQWNPDRAAYTTEEQFITEGKLGALQVTVTVGIQTVGETIAFVLHDNKRIGYQLNVKAQAKVAGKDIKPGELVSIGTEFSFEVETGTNKLVTHGDFDLVFSVMDSSEIIIAQTIRDCSKNPVATPFHYDLKQANLAAGALYFRFHVRDRATNIIHTEQRVSYQLALSMVASAITFQGQGKSTKPTYRIGQSASVTMVPASFPDLVNLYPYKALDVNGEDTSSQRTFYLDTYHGEELLHSFGGHIASDADGNVLVRFEVIFPATFNAIGNHEIRFRYVPRYGNAITLANYDSSSSELFDDVTPVGFNVEADLVIKDLHNAPKGGPLNYGNEISFTFSVVDLLSSSAITGSDSVFLTLSNQDSSTGKTYVSARDPAVVQPSGFSVDWVVNPNAIQGKGNLQLVAEIIGEVQVPLKTQDGKLFSVPVTIGGEISHTSVVRQVATPDGTHGAAVVELLITCEGKALSGAQLRADIIDKDGGEVVMSTPVARNDDNGKYTLSWAIPEEDAESDIFDINIYREVDKTRLGASAKPLFTFPVNFVGSSAHLLPFRTEALIFVASFAVFGLFSYRKFMIERQK